MLLVLGVLSTSTTGTCSHACYYVVSPCHEILLLTFIAINYCYLDSHSVEIDNAPQSGRCSGGGHTLVLTVNVIV